MRQTQNADSESRISLTIALPAYNLATLIGTCFQSLLDAHANKTWIEILVVNDGSQDRTSDVVRQWYDRLPNIRLIEQNNQGLAQTRNVLIAEAKGTYVWFVDPDDTVTHDSIDTLNRELTLDRLDEKNGELIDLLLFGFTQWGGAEASQMIPIEPVVPAQISNDLMQKAQTPVEGIRLPAAVNVFPSAWSAVVRRALFTENNITYPRNIWYEDLSVKAQLVLSAQRLIMREYSLYNYIDRPGSIMNTGDLEKNLDIIIALQHVRRFTHSLVRTRDLTATERRTVYDAVDFLTINQLMLSSAQRIWQIDPQARQLCVLRENLRRMVPQWYRNPLFTQMPIKRRALVTANAFGWHGANKFVS
ncbi:MAG: glycosyltransferase [Actinomycetaceae bacterium]|nr:glycosyltransferase [Actinomycetaceae bacterium]